MQTGIFIVYYVMSFIVLALVCNFLYSSVVSVLTVVVSEVEVVRLGSGSPTLTVVATGVLGKGE